MKMIHNLFLTLSLLLVPLHLAASAVETKQAPSRGAPRFLTSKKFWGTMVAGVVTGSVIGGLYGLNKPVREKIDTTLTTYPRAGFIAGSLAGLLTGIFVSWWARPGFFGSGATPPVIAAKKAPSADQETDNSAPEKNPGKERSRKLALEAQKEHAARAIQADQLYAKATAELEAQEEATTAALTAALAAEGKADHEQKQRAAVIAQAKLAELQIRAVQRCTAAAEAAQGWVKNIVV